MAFWWAISSHGNLLTDWMPASKDRVKSSIIPMQTHPSASIVHKIPYILACLLFYDAIYYLWQLSEEWNSCAKLNFSMQQIKRMQYLSWHLNDHFWDFGVIIASPKLQKWHMYDHKCVSCTSHKSHILNPWFCNTFRLSGYPMNPLKSNHWCYITYMCTRHGHFKIVSYPLNYKKRIPCWIWTVHKATHPFANWSDCLYGCDE